MSRPRPGVTPGWTRAIAAAARRALVAMRAGTRTRAFSTGVALVLVLPLLGAPAQTAPPGVGAAAPVSLEEVRARVAALEAAHDLDDAVRANALTMYRSAIAQLEATTKFQAGAREYRARLESAPLELAAARKTLEASRASGNETGAKEVPAGLPLAELESRLLAARAEEAARASEVQALDGQLAAGRDRPGKIRERMSELERTASKLEGQLDSTTASDEPQVVRDARATLLQAQYAAARAEIDALGQELLDHEPRMELQGIQLELAKRKLATAQATRQAIEARATEAQGREAARDQRQAAIARIEAMGQHPVLAGLANYSAELGATLTEIAASRAALASQLATIKKQAEDTAHDFRVTRQRVEIAGLSQALGRSLLEVRRALPDVKRYRAEVARRQATLTEIGLAQLRTSERKRFLAEFQQDLEPILTEGRTTPLSRAELERLRADLGKLDLEGGDLNQLVGRGGAARDALRKLIDDQQQLLDKMDDGYTDELRGLADLDFAQRELLAQLADFTAFLDRRLLWIPSTSPIGIETMRGVGPALGYLFSVENWKAVLAAVLAEARDAPLGSAIAAVTAFLLVSQRGRLRRTLVALGRRNRYPYADGYGVTIRAFGVTSLIAIGWPSILGFVGWRLQLAADSPVFVNALGYGLLHTAWLLLFFFGFRALCCKGGIAREQFKWRESVVDLLRRNLRWLLVITVPGVLITMTLSAQPDRAHLNSLGRLSFMLTLVAFAVFLQRVLGPGGGVAAAGGGDWLSRTRRLWYPLAFGVPYALAALAALGYFYSAGTLARTVYFTVWLLVGAKILNDLVVRWLVVTQRRLEWQDALAQRRGRAVGRAADHADTEGEAGPVSAQDDDGLDFHTINEHTRRLLSALLFVGVVVALIVVWSGVVPAFAVLQDVVLWEHTVTLKGQPQVVPVTLMDVGLAIAVGAVVTIAARNFPGLLEIALLQRLPLDAGVRYAITSLSQYLIVTVGIVVVFNTFGVGWSEVQWLAAALTVGLGFGLQEIFANFVSGLIILFERPIRIGDTVTIGGFTGTVTRIRIRATTITDWDNKEIVVPNKTFITTQLTNWTLSDPIVRVVIRVGVAYGSDPNLAHRVMLETAKANPMVLDHPAPSVYFLQLGESSLDFDVRVYVKSMDDWLPVVHAFHVAIVQALAAHGIEIPFPQRDLHVRSVHGLAVGAARGAAPEADQGTAVAGVSPR